MPCYHSNTRSVHAGPLQLDTLESRESANACANTSNPTRRANVRAVFCHCWKTRRRGDTAADANVTPRTLSREQHGQGSKVTAVQLMEVDG